VAINDNSLTTLAATSTIAVLILAMVWRPLVFSSVDPAVAAARGVPVNLLGIGFMIVLGATVAVSIQIVGALLVLALLCTPAAAAMRVTASPAWIVTLSVAFAVTAAVGGILTRPRHRRASQPLHHDDLLPHLPDLPHRRLPADLRSAPPLKRTVPAPSPSRRTQRRRLHADGALPGVFCEFDIGPRVLVPPKDRRDPTMAY
jgi:hypothetical protein